MQPAEIRTNVDEEKQPPVVSSVQRIAVTGISWFQNVNVQVHTFSAAIFLNLIFWGANVPLWPKKPCTSLPFACFNISAQSENHDEPVSLLRLPPSTLMSAGSPVTLPGIDHQSKLCGLVYAICVHREWAWIIHPAVSNLQLPWCCVCQKEEFAWSLLLSEKRCRRGRGVAGWGGGRQALNIERTVTGARLTNCSRTRHFTSFFFFSPWKPNKVVCRK